MSTPRIPRLVAIPATRLAIGTIRTYGFGLLFYGSIVVLQGPGRWRGPSYALATALAPSYVWGSAMALLGLITLFGSFRQHFSLRNVGLYGGAAWLAAFGYTTLQVAWRDPRVSYTGSILYLMTAAAMCWVARAREVPPRCSSLAESLTHSPPRVAASRSS